MAELWLPKTGQVTSYADGDDGYFQAGNPCVTRFVDNGNGTISDRATGLMWVKEPGACGGNFGSADSPATMTWANAVAECLGLTYASYADWRLPNKMELASLVNHGANPPIFAAFPATVEGMYWTSTGHCLTPTTHAFYCRFASGTGVLYTEVKTTPYYVRPVRGGRINANW